LHRSSGSRTDTGVIVARTAAEPDLLHTLQVFE
jgi:hypothetical protein